MTACSRSVAVDRKYCSPTRGLCPVITGCGDTSRLFLCQSPLDALTVAVLVAIVIFATRSKGLDTSFSPHRFRRLMKQLPLFLSLARACVCVCGSEKLTNTACSFSLIKSIISLLNFETRECVVSCSFSISCLRTISRFLSRLSVMCRSSSAFSLVNRTVNS